MMHQPFLEKLALHIHEKHPGLGQRLCIVLPNRRAGLFLKRHLIPAGDVPVWAPSIFSMEDFTASLSGLQVADPLELMTTLYEAHLKTEGSAASDFDGFYGWGRGLIRDFEDTDQYLIKPDTLFTYLSESKAMALWNPDQRPLTDFETKYLKFFNSLTDYYKEYTRNLLGRKNAYHGLACRVVAESPEAYCDAVQWNHILFAGFNALTPAQLTIIRYFIKSGKAEILWDADAYYLENAHQEAGLFLRKYKEDQGLGGFDEITDYFKTSARNITIAGVPRFTAQANLAGSILKNLTEAGDPAILNKTAVVLADESLLLPLLNAIPPEAGDFNITMGFPLQQSPVYNLFDSIFEMHVHATEGKSAGEARFYYRHLLAVLQHSYIQYLAGQQALAPVISGIRNSNKPFAGISDLETAGDQSEGLGKLLHLLMKKPVSVYGFTRQLAGIINTLKSGLTEGTEKERRINQAENEILYNIALIINKLQVLVGKAGYIGELRTLHTLFREAAAASPVAFYGEPLKGIQVMGMLETRVLDFENIILISANEDILPSARNHNSFIPFEIRREFGLPTHHEQQAVFAYHFYRLLQRCTNAWLIYNAEADELGGGEKSRFLSQIMHELPAGSPLNHISEVKPAFDAKLGMPGEITVHKDEAILEKITAISRKGISPTAITQYLNCSLKYYFNYVLGPGETEEVEETMDFRTLGTIIHEVVQRFFEPFVGSFPLEHDYNQMQKQAEQAIAEALQKHFPGGETTKGRNLLIIKVAEVWIRRFLEMEAETGYNPANGDHLIALEKQLTAPLTIDVPGQGKITVTLKGTADRIDRVNGHTRIIDYKTGKVEARSLKINDVASVFAPAKEIKEKAFQLLFYLYLAGRENIAAGDFSAGIITFRSLKDGYLPLLLQNNDSQPVSEAFEDELTRLLEELFNPGVPFAQTTFREHCSNCPYKAICNRDEVKRF